MTFSDQQIQLIERWAEIYLPISDMAAILEIPPEDLREEIRTHSSPASIAYRKGKALSKVKLLQQEMALAQTGSPLALQTTRDTLLSMEDDE